MNLRITSGVVLLVVVGVILYAGIIDTPLPTLQGLGCGSKAGMLADPEVKRILEQKYRIGKIDCPGDGSIKICSDKEALNKQDFVWPASLYAVELCKQTLGHNLEYDITFHSPIVFYSWDCVTDELVKRGQVKQIGGVYYIPDMQSFTQLVMEGRPWQGACGLAGKLRVIPTDPTKSNSGSEFVALLASMLLKGDLPTESTVEPILPELKRYIDSLGGLETTSSKLFATCTKQGMGACPIFAVYEAQGIDLIKQSPEDQKTITDRFRFLYPQPTVWAAHELIAITPKGKMLMEAMKDKQIQEIAWKSHGFRTGSLGNPNNPKDLGFAGIPESIESVVPLPSPAVMDRITEYLSGPSK